MDAISRSLAAAARDSLDSLLPVLARLRRWSATRDGRHLLVLLAAALLVRLVVAPWHGFFHDLQAYVTWGRIFDRDPLRFYDVASGSTVMRSYHINYLPNYPPLTIYLYGLLDAGYFAFARLFTAQPSFDVSQTPLLAVYARLPILGADLTTIALVYRLAREVRSARWALLAAGTYALSPLVLFDGALWGQTDALFLLVIVLALLCALRGRGILAGMLLAVAVLLKPQPIIFAPLVLFYLWRRVGLREVVYSLAAMLATALVCCLPFLLPPHPQILVFFEVLRSSLASAPFASIDAYNLWWLLLLAGHTATTPILGPLSPNALGDLLFVAAFAIVFAGLWRDLSARRLFLAATLLAVAFFVETTLQRQRYLFPAAGLFLLASAYDRRLVPFYVVSTATAFLNMCLSVVYYAGPGFFAPSDPGIDVGGPRAFLLQHGEITVLIAAANVWLLLVTSILYLRSGRSRSVPTAPLTTQRPPGIADATGVIGAANALRSAP